MTSVQGATAEELQSELDRRKSLAEEAKPVQLYPRDYSSLDKLCEEYIVHVAKKGYVDDDMHEYIFEAAMVAIFGKDVWSYINSRLR